MEAEMYAVRISFRLYKGRSEPVRLLLLACRGHEIMLLAPAALLLNYALYAAYLLLGVHIAAPQHLLLVCHKLAVPCIVALAHKEAGVLYLHSAPCNRVKEVPVVRYDYKRALVALQEFLKPGYGVHVKVVRRLVQQQKLRPGEQHLGKLRLVPLAAAHVPKPLVKLLFREAEAHKRAACAALICKAAGKLIVLP